MASFSSTYPAQRPVFSLDAANAGRLDPRMTFSRSDTPPTYAAPSAVHFWSNEKHLSSENLLTYSNPNNAAWDESNNATIGTNATAAPDGTTTASTITEDTATGVNHRVFLSPGNSANGQTYTFVGYFKANGRTFVGPQLNGSGITTTRVEFELSGSGTATSRAGSPANLSISQIGSTGWYKCSFQATASGSATLYLNIYLQDGANSLAYNGDGASGVYAWGCNVSTTGETVLNETNGSIHRQYAPTLKSVATAGQPRFEYDPSTDGQSMGCLIESQATNLNPYSDALASWGTNNALTLSANAGVGPDGSLGADLIVANTANDTHYIRSAVITVSAGSAYTFSGYFKSLNGEKLRLVFFQSAAPFTGEAGAVFTLTGSGSAAASAGSASITSVGNGYYRCTVTGTTLTTGSYLQVQTVSTSDSQVYVGNAYNGVLCAGIQFESGSHASSLISTSGSAVTRAAESLSVTDASIFTSGEHSVYWEGSVNGSTADPRLFALHNNSSTDRVMVDHNDGTKLRLNVKVGNTDFVLSETTTAIPDNSKVVATVKANEARLVLNGTTTVTDTSTPISSGYLALSIGSNYSGAAPLDGHIRRISYWNTALTETQAQAISS